VQPLEDLKEPLDLCSSGEPDTVGEFFNPPSIPCFVFFRGEKTKPVPRILRQIG